MPILRINSLALWCKFFFTPLKEHSLDQCLHLKFLLLLLLLLRVLCEASVTTYKSKTAVGLNSLRTV